MPTTGKSSMSTSDSRSQTPSAGPARPADLEAIRQLLRDSGLPTRGVDDLIDRFVVVRRTSNGEPGLIAAGAVEPCDRVGLLRSVVVHPDARGQGIGRMITDALIDAAHAQGFTALYLLTETAESFFNRTGFETIERETAPESIRMTEEFRSLCSESAALMRLNPVG